MSQEDPQKKKWQPTPLFLAGKYHGQRRLEGYSHMVSLRLRKQNQGTRFPQQERKWIGCFSGI